MEEQKKKKIKPEEKGIKIPEEEIKIPPKKQNYEYNKMKV